MSIRPTRRAMGRYLSLAMLGLAVLTVGALPALAQQPTTHDEPITLHDVPVHSPPAMLIPSSTSRPNGDVPLLYIAQNARIGKYEVTQAVLGIGENMGENPDRALGKSAGPLSGQCQTVTIHAVPGDEPKQKWVAYAKHCDLQVDN